MRAQAEQLPPMEAFRRLKEEVLNSIRTLELMLEGDEELKTLWVTYVDVSVYLRVVPGVSRLLCDLEQKYTEFHVNTKRYRVAELLS